MDPTKKELYTAKRSSGVDVSSPSIASTWAAVRSDDAATNWILLGYTASNCIDAIGSGSGGFDELTELLSEDKALFGGIRAVDKDGKVKFYFVYFVGNDLGGMAKGKASMHKSAVYAQLEGVHGELTVSSDEPLDVAIENAKEALQKLLLL